MDNSSKLSQYCLNLVLLEPEIPQNTGNIARTCAATGARLHLIRPFGFTIDDKKLKRAGLDYWHYLDISYYDGIDDFYSRHTDAVSFYFSTKAALKFTQITYPNHCFLFFGKETKGLPEEILLKNPKHSVRIPMLADIRSLNLANAAAIAAYEVLRQWDYPTLQTFGRLSKEHISENFSY